MVAIMTNSPVAHVWDMSIGQIMRYAGAGKALLPLINPFAGGDSTDTGGTKKLDANRVDDTIAFKLMAPYLGVRRG